MDAHQAILPNHLERLTPLAMEEGDIGFAEDGVMWVDKDRRCWLSPNVEIDRAESLRHSVKLTRESDGYHVWIRPPYDGPLKPTWKLSAPPLAHDESTSIPVAFVHPDGWAE